MKKFVITFVVLGFFVVYSAAIRHQNPVLSKPVSLTTTNTSPQPTSTPASNSSSSSSGASPPPAPVAPPAASSSGQYKDGSYTGSVADAYWGNVEVSATISEGKITDVKFLQYPNDHSTSVYINQQAMPYLKQEAISSQNANVQIISGATYTSQAFIQSLGSALSKA